MGVIDVVFCGSIIYLGTLAILRVGAKKLGDGVSLGNVIVIVVMAVSGMSGRSRRHISKNRGTSA